mmetsp:Transcript_8446/g.17586  ORF Transcript_8446/g.17586 Transcript_8446/m.17586 type:complete len:213 (+) Transcript_8446:56-694(+)
MSRLQFFPFLLPKAPGPRGFPFLLCRPSSSCPQRRHSFFFLRRLPRHLVCLSLQEQLRLLPQSWWHHPYHLLLPSLALLTMIGSSLLPSLPFPPWLLPSALPLFPQPSLSLLSWLLPSLALRPLRLPSLSLLPSLALRALYLPFLALRPFLRPLVPMTNLRSLLLPSIALSSWVRPSLVLVLRPSWVRLPSMVSRPSWVRPCCCPCRSPLPS